MDIVERLRKCADDPQDVTLGGWEAYAKEAADEIDRLREALRLVRDELDRRRKNAEEVRS